MKGNLKYAVALIGIGSYWAWNILDRSGLLHFGGFASGVDPLLITGVSLLVLVLAIPLVGFLKRPLVWYTIRILIVTIAVLAAVFTLLAYKEQDSWALKMLSSVFLAVLRSGSMIFWITWMISFRKRRLVHSLLVTATISAVSFLVTSIFPWMVQFASFLMLIALSGLCLLSVSTIDDASEGEIDVRPQHSAISLGLFFLVRCLLGISVGLFAALNISLSAASLSPVQSIMSLLFGATLILLNILFWKRLPYLWVFIAPMAIPLFMLVPLAIDPDMLPYALSVFIWLGTSFISIVQFYYNNGLMNMRTVTLVTVAMMVSTFTTFISNNITTWQRWPDVSTLLSPYLQIAISFVVLYTALAVVGLFLARISSGESARLVTDDSVQRSVARLTREYGLTERERDILELLAEGYSRPFISKQLFLSVNTIKTHTTHLYRKLGINKRDELLELIKLDDPHAGGGGGNPQPAPHP